MDTAKEFNMVFQCLRIKTILRYNTDVMVVAVVERNFCQMQYRIHLCCTPQQSEMSIYENAHGDNKWQFLKQLWELRKKMQLL